MGLFCDPKLEVANIWFGAFFVWEPDIVEKRSPSVNLDHAIDNWVYGNNTR